MGIHARWDLDRRHFHILGENDSHHDRSHRDRHHILSLILCEAPDGYHDFGKGQTLLESGNHRGSSIVSHAILCQHIRLYIHGLFEEQNFGATLLLLRCLLFSHFDVLDKHSVSV